MTETTEPVVEQAAQTPGESATETKGVDREDNGRFRNPVQPRIDELTRKVRDNEREAQYWRQRAEAKEAQTSAKAAPSEPKLAEFTDHDEYIKAQADYRAEIKVQDALKKDREERQAEQAKRDRFKTWSERANKSRETFKDFDDVLSASEVGVSDALRDALSDSDLETDLAYHLARHPELADRLNRMGEKAVNREIGRLEDKLRATRDEKPEVEESVEEVREAPVKQKTSAAPAPARPVSSGRSSTNDLSKMNMDDYTKARKAQGARWSR